MPKQLIAVPHRLREAFRRGLEHDRIVFLSAGAGWGKTAAVNSLLENRDAVYRSLRTQPLCSRFPQGRPVILDDLQELTPRAGQQLREVLRRPRQGQQLVLLSRGEVPECLAFCEAAGALLRLGADDLALDTQCLMQLSEAGGLSLSADELRRLRDETGGCPAAVNIFLQLLSSGQPLGTRTAQAMRGRMGAYLDEAVLRLLPPDARRLLTELSLFDRFDRTLAELLLGDGAGAGAWEALLSAGGLLCREKDGWRIAEGRFLLPWLRQSLLDSYPEGERRRIHLTGGRWYARRQDVGGAVYHYQQAGSREDMTEALIQAARLRPDAGGCRALRECYGLLTEEEVLRSPDLMYAMSMLRSAALEPEEAERWYGALEGYLRDMDRRDGDYPRVLGLQAWLDIGLPHRGTAGLAKKFPAVCKLAAAGELVLPEMSVTGGQPSLLRGGKDFSGWACGDERLRTGVCARAEKALGRRGVGLGELALTERLLEKGEDVSGRFLTLAALQGELRRRGTAELEFVLTALLVRALLAAGCAARARELLLRFRAGAGERGAGRLLPNVDAMRCRLSLMEDGAYAAVWFSEQAPDEEDFLGTEGYRYLTKARCYIRSREHHAALLLLGRMLDYARRYARPLDLLETLVLVSICRFRMENGDWREHFAQALELGERYGYTAVFAREGAALLPLLERGGHKTVQPDYWRRLVSGTAAQAGYYGQYLRPPVDPPRLTQAEATVLRLIGQDKSNEELCALLDIRLPTAKTHVRNLFRKLKVSSRAEAQRAAKQLGLL